jgi:chromosome segregation ATPase
MAKKSWIDDVIALAEALGAARGLVEHTDSLDRACAESEARLKELRAAEKVVKTELDASRERAHQVEEGAKVQAKAITDAAHAEAWKKRQDCEAACSRAEAASRAKVAALEAKAGSVAARVASLEDHEARAAQSVTALRAELDALRARVIG